MSKKKDSSVTTKKEIVAGELKELEAEHGLLRPADVVEKATNPDSPLHDQFTWDDSKAGHKYRLMEARLLINKVTVEWEGEEKEAFFNVKVNNLDRGYVSREVVLSDKDMQAQVLKYALDQIKHWQNTYKDVRELTGVVNEEQVSKLEESLN